MTGTLPTARECRQCGKVVVLSANGRTIAERRSRFLCTDCHPLVSEVIDSA